MTRYDPDPARDLPRDVTEWGPADADVTVVLTHGWTLSGRIWEDVAALLAAADPRCGWSPMTIAAMETRRWRYDNR